MTMEPIALEARPPEEECQVGVAARPLSVSQIPPPAAPTQTRQSVSSQVLEIAMAVTRPEAVVVAPVYVTCTGTLPTTGPTRFQEWPPALLRLERARYAWYARIVWSYETEVAG